MGVASLGFRTDLMLLALGGSEIEARAGRTVVRTPSNPGFYWGNFLLLAGPDAVGPAASAAFAQAFPAARHVALGVDGTDGAPGIEAAAGPLGLRVERISVLTAERLQAPARPNAEAEYRMLDPDDDADWAQAVDLQLADRDPDTKDDRVFVERRVAALRALQHAGHGGWFGAFVEGTMRAGLGVFTDGGGLGRYQNVDTHPGFRRRGLARSLVHVAGRHALASFGVDVLVITADPGYHAIAIYRSLGFTASETQVQLLRPPAG